jgi:hypothetical protein
VSRTWRVYAEHILDTVEKIRRIQQRGDLTQDEVLYDASCAICTAKGSEVVNSP